MRRRRRRRPHIGRHLRRSFSLVTCLIPPILRFFSVFSPSLPVCCSSSSFLLCFCFRCLHFFSHLCCEPNFYDASCLLVLFVRLFSSPAPSFRLRLLVRLRNREIANPRNHETKNSNNTEIPKTKKDAMKESRQRSIKNSHHLKTTKTTHVETNESISR